MSSGNPGGFQLVIGTDQQLVVPITQLPRGISIDAARIVVKVNATDVDGDALIDVSVPGNGQIVNDTPNLAATVTFFFTATDTQVLSPDANYVYFVKLRYSDGSQVRPLSATGLVTAQVAGITANV